MARPGMLMSGQRAFFFSHGVTGCACRGRARARRHVPTPTSCLDDMVAAPLGRRSWVGVLMGTARGRRRDGGRFDAWVGSPPGRYHAGIFVDYVTAAAAARCARGAVAAEPTDPTTTRMPLWCRTCAVRSSPPSGALYLCLAAAAIPTWAARVCGCGICCCWPVRAQRAGAVGGETRHSSSLREARRAARQGALHARRSVCRAYIVRTLLLLRVGALVGWRSVLN